MLGNPLLIWAMHFFDILWLCFLTLCLALCCNCALPPLLATCLFLGIWVLFLYYAFIACREWLIPILPSGCRGYTHWCSRLHFVYMLHFLLLSGDSDICIPLSYGHPEFTPHVRNIFRILCSFVTCSLSSVTFVAS